MMRIVRKERAYRMRKNTPPFLSSFILNESISSARARRALEILKERYAKGEVTREQFSKMKRELEA